MGLLPHKPNLGWHMSFHKQVCTSCLSALLVNVQHY
jgi:hypothetical protein